MTLYYLAHPYSNNPAKNVEAVNEIAAKLFVRGYCFYSPISMTPRIHKKAHELGLYEGEYWEEWMKFDYELMIRCDGIILCPGWEQSKGCKQERLHFLYNKKPILLFEEIIKKED